MMGAQEQLDGMCWRCRVKDATAEDSKAKNLQASDSKAKDLKQAKD